jgi:hypothetical protein
MSLLVHTRGRHDQLPTVTSGKVASAIARSRRRGRAGRFSSVVYRAVSAGRPGSDANRSPAAASAYGVKEAALAES